MRLRERREDGALARPSGRAPRFAREDEPSLTVGLLPRIASLVSRIRFLRRRWFQNRWSVRLCRLFFGLIGRKIFFVDVDNLHFRAELAIATEQNFVPRLLSLSGHSIRQLHDGARGQQVLLLI